MRNVRLQCGILLAAFSLVSGTVAMAATDNTASKSDSTTTAAPAMPAPAATTTSTKDSAVSGKVSATGERLGALRRKHSPLDMLLPRIQDNSVPAVDAAGTDSEDAIKTANDLHKQAYELSNARDFDKAIALEIEAVKAAPHYWLPRAALGYLYYAKGDKMHALSQAGQSTRTEHPLLADSNLAILLENIRFYSGAVDEYKIILESQPDSWRAKIGMAQCYVAGDKFEAAKKILTELEESMPTAAGAYIGLGSCYSKMDQFDRATKYLIKAQGMTNDPKDTAEIERLLFITAVRNHDADTTRKYQDKVAPLLKDNQAIFARAGSLLSSQTPLEARAALEIALAATKSDREARDFANIFQEKAAASSDATTKKAWNDLAKTAYEQAIAYNADDLRNHVLLAGTLEQLGDVPGALKHLSALSDQVNSIQDDKIGDDLVRQSMKKQRQQEWQGLAKGFTKASGKEANSAGYRSNLMLVEYKQPDATCRCKYNTVRQLLRQQPGVVDAIIGKGDNPLCFAIYDGKKTNPDKIFNDETWKKMKETVERHDVKPVPTITALAQLENAQDDTPPKIIDAAMQNVVLEMPAAEEPAKVSSDKTKAL